MGVRLVGGRTIEQERARVEHNPVAALADNVGDVALDGASMVWIASAKGRRTARFTRAAEEKSRRTAASRRRSARKPLLALTASPMSSADLASPCARTMIDCFSWIAWSTRKAARWAVCCAICLAVEGVSEAGRMDVSPGAEARWTRPKEGRTLNRVRELGRKGDVRDRDVVEHQVELMCPPDEVLPHQPRNLTEGGARGMSAVGQR